MPLTSQTTSNQSFKRWTIMDYSKAYTSLQLTPTVVAERFIEAVHESSEMSFFISYDTKDIRQQAQESTLRYAKGEPISALDGVLIAIKDEIDCTPYPTTGSSTGGTKWLHEQRPCTNDACSVKRLRLCATRNPYDPNKISGGSSSGSAAVVAAGLCPVALGVDGG
ncbi:hypothetical protein G4B88_002433, partial [Cannabis sativa]